MSDLNLIFDNKIFKIPYNHKVLMHMNLGIYSYLLTNHEYEVRSKVNEDVFRSFFNYMLTGKIPDFISYNISQYQLLSQEFDLMKDLVELFLKKSGINLYLSIKNDKIRKEINEKQEKYVKMKENFKKINQILFYKNEGINSFSEFVEIKQKLLDGCQIRDIDYVSLLVKKKVQRKGLIYILNLQEKTAGVYSQKNEDEIVFIPKSIFNEEEEFLVTSICPGAFQNSQCIKSIQFPSDSELKLIGKYSFCGSSLNSILIPSRVIKIDEYAFSNCNNLKKIEFEVNSELLFIGSYAFASFSLEEIAIPSSVTEIHEECFASTRKLNCIKIIEKEVKNISLYDDSFVIGKSSPEQNNYDVIIVAKRNIRNVTIPSFIKYINAHSFQYCSRIQKFEFAENSELSAVGEFSFSSSSITRFTVPLHVTIIKKNAFLYCRELTEIEFQEKSEIHVIEQSAFANTPIKRITLPSSIAKIQKHCFAKTPQLTDIQIIECEEKNISYFNNSLLVGKSNPNQDNYDVLLLARRDIKIEIIPSFIKYIKSFAFSNCMTIKNIQFDKNSELLSIGKQSFAYSSIESIIFPSSLIHVSEVSFSYCNKLKKVEFGSNSFSLTIGENCFSYSSIESIIIPSDSTIDKNCFKNIEKLKEIKIIPRKQKNIVLYDDSLLIGKSSKNQDNYDLLLIAKRDIVNAIIPPFIKRISSYAFYNCLNLNSIQFIGNSELKSIGSYAFSKSSIRSVSLPNKTEKIGEFSFDMCQNLKSIEFQPNSELKIIESSAFSNSSIETLTIPSSVVDIQTQCFVKTPNLNNLRIIQTKEKNFLLYKNSFIIGKSNLSKQEEYDVIVVARRNIRVVNIPPFIRKISSFAFYGCKNIRHFEISENSQLNSIGSFSFAFSSISSLFIPKTVKSINFDALCSGNKLLIVEIEGNWIKMNLTNYFYKGIIMIPVKAQ